MIFFGWGSKSQSWSYSDGQLIVKWNYFHFFLFPIASNITWHLIGDKRSEDKIITYEEVQKMFPENTPKLNHWSRFGLLYLISFIILVALINN